MAASGGSSDPDAVLRGIWGTFTSAAEQHADTATIWQNIRSAADSWARATAQAIYGPNVTEDQIAARSQQLIGGITIQDVNRYRSLAGQYVQAKANAQASGSQFEASDFFVAPWSQMARSGGSVRNYRANITFQSIFAGVNGPVALTETRSYLIGPTLTNAEDLIAAAKSWYGKLPYNVRLSSIDVSDFALEAV